MAVVTPNGASEDGKTYRAIWENVAPGDTCAPFQLPGHPDKTLQVFGSFAGSAVITLEGTCENAPANYSALHDDNGDAISVAAAGVVCIKENVNWYKPVITSGVASSLTIILFAK
jgi:hypothetical protein